MIDGINPIYATGYLKVDDFPYNFYFETSFVSCVLVKNKPNNWNTTYVTAFFFALSSLNQNSLDVWFFFSGHCFHIPDSYGSLPRRKTILVKNWHLWKNDGDQNIGSKKVNWMEMTPEQNDWDHTNGKQKLHVKTWHQMNLSVENWSFFCFFSCGSRLPGENATLASFRVQGYQMKRQTTFFFSGPSIVAGYQVKTREFQGGFFILP